MGGERLGSLSAGAPSERPFRVAAWECQVRATCGRHGFTGQGRRGGTLAFTTSAAGWGTTMALALAAGAVRSRSTRKSHGCSPVSAILCGSAKRSLGPLLNTSLLGDYRHCLPTRALSPALLAGAFRQLRVVSPHFQSKGQPTFWPALHPTDKCRPLGPSNGRIRIHTKR